MTGFVIEYQRQMACSCSDSPLSRSAPGGDPVGDVPVPADHDLEAGDLAGVDVGRPEVLVDTRQPLRIEAGGVGVRGRSIAGG